MEDLHGDFGLSMILPLEFDVLDVNVFFDILCREDDLFVDTGAESGHERPISDSQGETEDEDEEPVGVEASAVDDWEDALDDPGDTEYDGGEMVV